ncbi:MAG: response regulator [Thermoplasmata archaeon]|nr:response regulator [Thermoplasmata archaeon]MBE3137712.1 response regulator [Thermoplasmata archaeon]MBE3140207.1 response regulator [Thermoplasmata archaeon]
MVKTILVVDDYIDTVLSVKHVLEDTTKEYQVIGVDSGEKCLKVLQGDHLPDLILLDIMMPGMSGWDVAARIKENDRWSAVPIVFLTAVGDEMSAGAGLLTSEGYIVKPFDIVKLKECVKRILAARSV